MVGAPLAETREVNPTWLGRIVHRMVAPKTNMTVTAFQGWLSLVTWPIYLDPGQTPSPRATVNTRQEAATTVMFYS